MYCLRLLSSRKMRYIPVDRDDVGLNRESSKTANRAVMISSDSLTFNPATSELIPTGGEEQYDERTASHGWL
jgi:hypothetical protein